MQSIIVLVVIGISSVLGDVSQYTFQSGTQAPQRALLVLPPQQTPQTNATPQQTPQTNATPQTVQNEENLEKLNDNVMERLRQETGSNTGIYYVYLPDGRLQRIQYTTAPIKQQDPAGQTQQRQSNDSETSQTEQSSQYKQNSFKAGSSTPQGSTNQQSNTQVVFGTNKQTTQGNQQQQLRTNYEANQQQGRSIASYQQYEEQQFGNPAQLLAQYNGPQKLQTAPAAPSYIASVQFTDIPPIHGPVYAYRPSPLVRIVRYSNNY